MNKLICRMALALAVASLVGCGLKGPLYFPPAKQPAQQTSPVDKPTRADAQAQSTTTDASQTESQATPDTGDAPLNDGLVPSASGEADVPSAQ
ncbi:lipoprotein [Erwinia sp. P6884]|uniref:LPS translocon maturation chaperone LptM n=1 Tax=Erwinia sp. P6884 TaxID=3141450 RepID=UPI003199FC73